MSADSHSLYHGDSLVSVFSMDRGAADIIKESQQQDGQPQIDFEKEEFRQRIAELEDKLAARDLDLAKSHKLIKGLRKLVPNPDEQSSAAAATETPSFINDKLAKDRERLLADLGKTSSSDSIAVSGDTFQPQNVRNITAAIDLVMNGTLAPEDLQTMKYEFVRFRDLCSKMFQQLQGTASFLEKLIRHLENSDDEAAKKLLEKIKGIHLDLNMSMNDASIMIESAQSNLNTALEKSIRVSMAPNSEIIVLSDKIVQAEKKYVELEKKYSNIVHNVTFLNKQNEKLQQELRDAQEKAENLQNALLEKEGQLSQIMEEKRIAAEKAQNLVPEILQEMTNIKTTLEDVSKASKNLPKQVRRR
uniref:Uncharacterized protein n=1 Tax=Panagrolaimus sp. PS1159 TaxID=55785 RepID=A0AC35FN64_9BILA